MLAAAAADGDLLSAVLGPCGLGGGLGAASRAAAAAAGGRGGRAGMVSELQVLELLFHVAKAHDIPVDGE